MTLTNTRRTPLFAGLAALVLVSEWVIVHTIALSESRLLAPAILSDLTLVLPALYYGLVLRPTRRPLLEAAPIATAGSLVAAILLHGHQPTASLVLWAGILAEFAVLALLGMKLYAATQKFKSSAPTDDLLLRLDSLPERWVRILGLELVVLYYAFVGPRTRPVSNPNTFSYTEKSGLGGLLFALGFVTVVEGLVVHFLLRQWRPVAGWIFTGLHAYTLLWLSAAYQAARLRPILLTETTMLLRLSLLWTAEIPLEQVARVESIKERPQGQEILRAAFGDDPRLLLTLKAPFPIRGLLGVSKTVTQIALYVDEPERLRSALQAAGTMGV